MHYHELTLKKPGFKGGQARQFLAKLADEYDLEIPPAFFHYTQPDSEPGKGAPYPVSTGPAPIRIHGNGRNIRIVAVSEEGTELIRQAAPALMNAIIEEDGTAPEYRWRSGEFSMDALQYPASYSLGTFVMNVPRASRSAVLQELKAAPACSTLSEDTFAIINDCVKRAFAVRCRELQLDPLGEIEQLKVERTFPIHVRERRAMLGVRATCRLQAELIGPWQIGALQARGYGGITRVRTGSQLREAS